MHYFTKQVQDTIIILVITAMRTLINQFQNSSKKNGTRRSMNDGNAVHRAQGMTSLEKE